MGEVGSRALVRARPLGKEEAARLLSGLGLVVDVGDVLCVEQLSRETYRVVLAKSGVAAEVFITRQEGRWRRTSVRIHELVKIVDAGVKL